MKIKIGEINVYFPYEHVYPEQYEYMKDLYQSISSQKKNNGHCLLEMPCGTGKTIALLSLIVSWQLATPKAGKLVYCTRTVTEMNQVFGEMKVLNEYLTKVFSRAPDLLCVGLSSRKNLCTNEEVNPSNGENIRDHVDSKCRSMSAKWVIDAIEDNEEDSEFGGDIEEIPRKACKEFVKLNREYSRKDKILHSGVYGLDEMKEFARENSICPYFLARRVIEHANVVVFNYQYLIDPKISPIVTKSFTEDAVIVFDEAHNIDSLCLDVLSVDIDTNTLKDSVKNVKNLINKIEGESERIKTRLQDEYNRLVDGLASEGVGYQDAMDANPVLPEHILHQAVPGTIRKGRNFLNFLRRVMQFLGTQMKSNETVITFPSSFLEKMNDEFFIEQKTLRFCSSRLISLFNTLQITNLYEYKYLKDICDFCSLLGTYQNGFNILIEIPDKNNPHDVEKRPTIRFSCLDSRIAMKPLLKRFKNVVITSGTLSPLHVYPKLLGMDQCFAKSFEMTLVRKCICPVIVTKGNDQTPLTSRFTHRNDSTVSRNYGNMLLSLAKIIPDGIVCFFPSYRYLEELYTMWYNMEIISDILKEKLIFVETRNTQQTTLALLNHKKACDSGRGSIFLCISRGKVSEGVDFEGHYGRAVIMFGFPVLNTHNQVLKSRLNYVQKEMGINNDLFLNFDAIRCASQCISRCLRNKTDYGVMILADKRYAQKKRRKLFPKWIKKYLIDEHVNLAKETAMGITQKFLLEMSQSWNEKEILGKVLLSKEQIDRGDIPKPVSVPYKNTFKQKSSISFPKPTKSAKKREKVNSTSMKISLSKKTSQPKIKRRESEDVNQKFYNDSFIEDEYNGIEEEEEDGDYVDEVNGDDPFKRKYNDHYLEQDDVKRKKVMDKKEKRVYL